jgi:hypothetical protein
MDAMNLNLVLAMSSNRLLKPSFANVAPRADHIRNHINSKTHFNSLFNDKSRSSLP